MARSGFAFSTADVLDLELAYIGGLLRLDQVFDQDARARAFETLNEKAKRGPSPMRKG